MTDLRSQINLLDQLFYHYYRYQNIEHAYNINNKIVLSKSELKRAGGKSPRTASRENESTFSAPHRFGPAPARILRRILTDPATKTKISSHYSRPTKFSHFPSAMT
jgi:hypothetical protein